MRFSLMLLALCLPLVAAEKPAAEKAAYDSNGRIVALLPDAEDFEVASNLVAVLPSGRRVALQVRRDGAGATRSGDALKWTSSFTLPDGGRGRMELQSEEDGLGVRYSAVLTAETDLDVTAIEFVIDVPRLAFLKGRLLPEGSEPVVLGPVKPPDPTLFRGETATLRFEDAAGKRTLSIGFDKPRSSALVDRWDTSGRSYQLRAAVQQGAWSAGAKAGITATLRLSDRPDPVASAHLVLDTSNSEYRFQGFGGNYCWDNRSPIAAYTLKNLKISWARTAMNLIEWEKHRDAPGPDLRADLEAMRRFQQMGVPYVISVWSIPERFYTDPYEKPPSAHSRVINPEKWDDLLDLMGSYLLYAKREYSTEPDLFSFNEANIGINIGLTPASYDESVKRVGAYFGKLGLKTKILLGDTGGPRDTHKFALEAASDPGVAQFLGAVAFHSWGGATPEQYGEWSSLAEWLNLPLLVTELGVDPSAYYTRSWNPSQEHYGSKKMRNWDLAIRTADQNSQGVIGEVVFPNTVPPFYRKSIVTAHPPKPGDYEGCLAGIRAHNRWLKDFCAEDPARRAGIGLILPNDFDEAVKDIDFIARAGLRGGVLLPLIPPDATWLKPLYDPAWDKVFAAIQDHGLVLNQHTGQGLPDYGAGAVAESIWIQDVTFYGQAGWRHLLMAGVYEKFPKLKHILTESGCAWVPAMLAQLDRAYFAIKAGSTGEMNYAGMELPLKAPPSEYALQHCYYGASFPSSADLAGIDQIGEDHVLWGNDYPHYEGTFPHNLESLRLTFGAMPDARRRKVLGLNAAALYGFDLEKLRPLAARYGPTPAEVETPLPQADIPRDCACYLFRDALKEAS